MEAEYSKRSCWLAGWHILPRVVRYSDQHSIAPSQQNTGNGQRACINNDRWTLAEARSCPFHETQFICMIVR